MFDNPDSLQIWVTFTALGISLFVVGWMVRLERRPRDITRPQLIPTTPVMFLAAMAAMLALIHLVNLLGFKTGRQ